MSDSGKDSEKDIKETHHSVLLEDVIPIEYAEKYVATFERFLKYDRILHYDSKNF